MHKQQNDNENIWGDDNDDGIGEDDVPPFHPNAARRSQESTNRVTELEHDTAEDPASQSSEQPQGMMKAARSQALRPFVIISSSYLLFTITDGAIRMIVLLHAYSKSFTAMEVAIMFTLYEMAGVVTNLAAGVMGATWGIKFTLTSGLALQLVSYGLLFGWQDDWDKRTAIIYVTVAQMFAGIAKDLTKLGGKTVTKLVTPDEQETQLFKLVSFITGFKNSLKGVSMLRVRMCRSKVLVERKFSLLPPLLHIVVHRIRSATFWVPH